MDSKVTLKVLVLAVEALLLVALISWDAVLLAVILFAGSCIEVEFCCCCCCWSVAYALWLDINAIELPYSRADNRRTDAAMAKLGFVLCFPVTFNYQQII